LRELLQAAGHELDVPSRATIALRLTDDAELRALNARHLGVDEPTDVLAFPAEDDRHPDDAFTGTRVGDVAISVERAKAQSDDHIAELRLLAVHGLLHCLGHEHRDLVSAKRMSAVTRRLLRDAAVPELRPT
jgi:probable rRNA maturation factor